MKQSHEAMTAQDTTSGKALRERAEMLVQVSKETGLPLDDSGPSSLNEAIYQALQAAEIRLPQNP